MSSLHRISADGCAQANIVRRDPREEQGIKMERVRTQELKPSSKHTRNFMERSMVMKVLLKIIGVLGVSLVMSGKNGSLGLIVKTCLDLISSDGVLTPAQSVLGAIQG